MELTENEKIILMQCMRMADKEGMEDIPQDISIEEINTLILKLGWTLEDVYKY
jgi:hypothetical protein